MLAVSRLLNGTVTPGDPLRYGRLTSEGPAHLLHYSQDKKPIVVWNLTRRCNLYCAHCYADATVWDGFDPKNMTLCSPDPQAFRPPEEPANVLQVSLPTNFKAARFEDDAATAMLRTIQKDIEDIRFDADGDTVELPVKLKVHDSVFVPLAKWSMLLTGNYRCIRPDDMISIREAVHTDLDKSRAVYQWVGELCAAMGAAPEDQVPFEKYAAAAKGLLKPSSAARALAAGAPNIERVDLLVQAIAKSKGMQNDEVDATCRRVNGWLERNRAS